MWAAKSGREQVPGCGARMISEDESGEMAKWKIIILLLTLAVNEAKEGTSLRAIEFEGIVLGLIP